MVSTSCGRFPRPILLALAAAAGIFMQIGGVGDASAQPNPKPGGGSTEAPLLEQTIYVPYEKLNDVFERQGRGIFLPYEEFEALWKAARTADRPKDAAGPPVAALITEIDHEAAVTGDVMQVRAVVRIDLLRPGWHEIPLRLAHASVGRAVIGDAAARLIGDAEAGYALVVQHGDEEPRQIELELEYATRIRKQPGRNQVSIHPPLAAVNRWTIRINEPGIEVQLKPLVAATRLSAAETGDEQTDEQTDEGARGGADGQAAEETVVAALVGATPQFQIEWTPRAEGASGLSAVATVETTQQVVVEEGIVRTRNHLAYTIRRAELSELVVDVPRDQKVVAVSDANIRRWQIDEVEGVQRIRVELFEAARASQHLQLDLEQLFDIAAGQEVVIPTVKAVGVGRQQGIVVARVAEGLRGEVLARSGVAQIDAASLPGPLAGQAWNFSYRYAAVPFEIRLDVERVLPRIESDTLVAATIATESLELDVATRFEIRRAAIFALAVEIPREFEVVRVTGLAGQGLQPVQVDSFHVQPATDDGPPRLDVNLQQRALGQVGLLVRLRRKLSDPNLQKPTGNPAELTLEMPRPRSPYLAAAEGRVVVHAPAALRVTPGEATAFRSVGPAEAVASFPELRAGVEPLPAVLAFRFAGNTAATLTLQVERRKPAITARQLLAIQVEPGVARFQATFLFDVKYSGVEFLQIAVPAATSESVRNRSVGIRDETADGGSDADDRDVTWKFFPEREFLGESRIVLEWETPLSELEIGKTVSLDIPRLRPLGVDRGWGQIVVGKAENIDVQPAEPTGLTQIDPRHDLMPGAPDRDAAFAAEFHDSWHLDMRVTRYELEAVKATSIERAMVRAVVTQSDQTAVQAVYRVRSAGQRLLIRLPREVAEGGATLDTNPLRVNGRPVALERGSDPQSLYIPLAGGSTDQPVIVELRYAVPSTQSQIDVPTFPEDPAVQRTYLAVYVPENLAYLGSRGPWSEEMSWGRDERGRWAPLANKSEDELILDVLEEGSAARNSIVDFPTSGRMLLYSAIRPAPPPDGSLKIASLKHDWLNALVIGSLAVVGVALVRRSFSDKAVAIGSVFAAALLVGIFLPSASQQLLGRPLMFAFVLVGLIWIVVAIARLNLRAQVGSLIRTRANPPQPSETSVGGESPNAAATPAVADRPGEEAATEPTTDDGADAEQGEGHE